MTPQAPVSERYSVTFVPPAVKAINELAQATGLSKTDVINRAVQVYAVLEEARLRGDQLLLRDPDGTTRGLVVV
jgi:hypothetical protein